MQLRFLMKVFLKEDFQSLSPNFAGLACGRGEERFGAGRMTNETQA